MADAVSEARKNFEFQRIIAIVGAVIMIAKFFAYFITNSVAILTDALESIVNVVAGVVGLYALFLSMQPADANHPYGHGKVELISSSIEGSLIGVAGVLIILESVDRLIHPTGIRELDVGLLIVILAAVANFAMGYTAVKRGRSNGSVALEASGKHLCTDTYSSIGIIIGLAAVYIGGMFGLDIEWMDPLMAMLFGFFIIFTGCNVLYKSMNGIMDTADENVLTTVTKCINHVRTPDVIDVHHLRVVRYGMSVHIDAHMTVPEDMTVGQVDVIFEMFKRDISQALGSSADITLMAESCCEVSCKYCCKDDCMHRKCTFESIKTLGPDIVRECEAPTKKVNKDSPYRKDDGKE